MGEFVSIVVPCLNEELVVGEFVDWCFQGLRHAGVDGEVLILDSSTDRSPEIAEQHHARVVRVPMLGLGRAYIDGLAHIRGPYVIMGDCDLTYDFREIEPFIDKLRQGFDFVMGTRIKGYIEPGAMPWLHRYFGTPITSWILNVIYGTRYSDIHCGMRAMTLEALKRMSLQSQSWEYASEMVLKAAKLKLASAEVPIRFYRDRPGRSSHHKRSGWLSPWIAGWSNLRVMLVYAPDVFLLRPGMLLLIFGTILTLMLAGGPVMVGYLGLNLHWMLLGLTLATVGYSAVQLGLLARVYHNFDPHFTNRLTKVLTYNRGIISGAAMTFIGATLDIALVIRWLQGGFRLSEISYQGVLGLFLIITGFQTLAFTLMLEMISNRQQDGGNGEEQ
jgi:glycosyltransferase involved in cell wall biosynthesis